MSKLIKENQGKKAVVRLVEGKNIIFECEGSLLTIPVKDVPKDLKDLIAAYGKWPGVLPGTEVTLGITRCQYHWHMSDCWAAYQTYKKGKKVPNGKKERKK